MRMMGRGFDKNIALPFVWHAVAKLGERDGKGGPRVDWVDLGVFMCHDPRTTAH